MGWLVKYPEFRRRLAQKRFDALAAEVEAQNRFDDIETREDIELLRTEDPFLYLKFMMSLVTATDQHV